MSNPRLFLNVINFNISILICRHQALIVIEEFHAAEKTLAFSVSEFKRHIVRVSVHVQLIFQTYSDIIILRYVDSVVVEVVDYTRRIDESVALQGWRNVCRCTGFG